jgi:hypothetical protein
MIRLHKIGTVPAWKVAGKGYKIGESKCRIVRYKARYLVEQNVSARASVSYLKLPKSSRHPVPSSDRLYTVGRQIVALGVNSVLLH